MTCDERLEALLNRAGQTISDLPEEYSENKAEAVFNLFEFDGELDATAYIIHLAAIIDRMEAALENTLGERDWLVTFYEINEGTPWYGVPEDWGADDD